MKTKLVVLSTKLITLVGKWWDEFALFSGTMLIAFFSPISHWVKIVGFLVLADLITGIIASIIKERKEKKTTGFWNFLKIIKSAKLFRTITKFVIYGIALKVAHIVQSDFAPDVAAIKLMTAFIAAIELKSMDENYRVITGRSFFKFIIDIFNNMVKQKSSNKKDE